MALFGWRKRQDEDPFAALRSDTPVTSGAMPVPAPAFPPAEVAPGDARIVARRDTGVHVAGSPRAQLTIAHGFSTFDTYVIVAAGLAADVGDTVDLVEEDGEVHVRLRPALRPTRSK